MRVKFSSPDGVVEVECESGTTVHGAIKLTPIHPSTVLAVHDGAVIPQNTIIHEDVEIELIIVSSGG
ncbi:MAG TPA: hypothetical protein EYN46_02260 [Candidatus Poseidoniales archaeon]|nr:MAG: hypothetical protein CXX80_07920 [Euryarchaeota archaeon]HIA40091.1 hypothetical protein [Candidatus Poseidoniales archaeon]HIB59037.1 hypothetical protein [Candidatus Poseidoniales archaeon]HIO94164.1 hypothetical protein [Candidatus Poseidoniales archaeon]